MTITGISSTDNYVLASLQARAKSANSTAANTTGTNTISLSTDSIDFALGGDAPSTDASNQGLLSYNLNGDILGPTKNLAGVGGLIDAYTNSLSKSNVYDSSYTTPSAKFLTDLADLKTAAASGDQAGAESALAAEKADAPNTVAGGEETAVAIGDTAGIAGLQVEATANISDYLQTQGYSSKGAIAEATAVEINGDTLDSTFTSTYTTQTRLQQIQDLSLFAANNTGSTNSVSSTTSNPLFNIYETLLGAKSGSATDQSLTNLDIQYAGSTSNTTSSNA